MEEVEKAALHAQTGKPSVRGKTLRKLAKGSARARGRITHFFKRARTKIRNYRFAYCVRHRRGKIRSLDVADMFYLQIENKELFRYDMIVRYLAIENYYGKNDIGLELYRKMQDDRIGSDHGEKAVDQFRELIQSYEENGYDNSSYIVADKNLNLVDGSHRMAMALYHEIRKINVLVINIEHSVDYSIDWFFQKGFTDEEIDLILRTAEQIKEEINTPFSCVIWDPAFKFRDDIIKDLGYYGEVIRCIEHEYRPEEYQNIVRAIYAVDDIEQWKIEKKIEYMGIDACRVLEADVKFDDPHFRIKEVTGLPLSISGERAKKTLRERYRPQVENYFFDIIMHIGDNHLQSEYMRKVFDPSIDFNDVLEILNQYKYVLTKVDVPYMPLEFPNRVPSGKDIDIICSKDDYENIRSQLIAFAKKFKDYELVVRELKGGFQLRFEISGKLIFLIDCKYFYEEIPDEFLSFALQNRYMRDGYYLMDPACEAIIRRVAYEKDESKDYHKKYYEENKTSEVVDLFEKFTSGGGKTILGLIPEFRVFLNEKQIPIEEVCIVGSSVMDIFGIRESHDLDFIVSYEYSSQFSEKAEKVTDSGNIEKVNKNWLRNDKKTVFSDDEIITNEDLYFIYQGFKVAKLPLLVYKKTILQREKDLLDLELIQATISSI